MGRRHFPLPSGLECLRERRSSLSGVPGRALVEDENDFCALFSPEKSPYVNRILLPIAIMLRH